MMIEPSRLLGGEPCKGERRRKSNKPFTGIGEVLTGILGIFTGILGVFTGIVVIMTGLQGEGCGNLQLRTCLRFSLHSNPLYISKML